MSEFQQRILSLIRGLLIFAGAFWVGVLCAAWRRTSPGGDPTLSYVIQFVTVAIMYVGLSAVVASLTWRRGDEPYPPTPSRIETARKPRQIAAELAAKAKAARGVR